MRRQNRSKSESQTRRGVTLVEFALVFPVFLLFVFAAVEFAHLSTLRNTANNAAYEAARVVMVPGAKMEEATHEAARILGTVGTHSFDIVVSPEQITSDTDSVSVSISIPYEENSLMVPWFSNGITIRTKATLKTERYKGFSG